MSALLITIFFWFGWAHAQEPVTAELRLPVKEGSYVHVLQKIQPKMSEIVIHKCPDCKFEEKYRSIYTDKIQRLVPVQLDEDSWVLRVFFYLDIYSLDVTISNGYMDIWVLEDRGIEYVAYESPYSVEEFLVATEEDIDQIYPPDMKILFLHGGAMSLPLKFDNQFFALCSPKDSLKDKSIADLKNYYNEMKSEAMFTEWGDALYALGWKYYQEELFFEADYYFEKHQDRIGSTSPRCRAIVDTHLSLRKKEWSKYQKGVQSAYLYGGSELQTLGALAYLSHETGYPSRKKVAQTLRAMTAEPNHLLLAAELFQMSGYYRESLELLADLYDRGVFLEEPEKDTRVALRYGDALYVDDRMSEAKKVWRSIPQELSMMRHILAILNEEINVHAKWPHTIPFLYRVANNLESEEEARAEAMYLIAQIQTVLSAPKHAMKAWKTFILEFKQAGLSDAGSNLWALYYLEVMDLREKEDWGGIIELHEEIWFDGMLNYALDPQVFQHVIDAYMNFGFEEEAIVLTRKLRPQQQPFFTEEEEARSFITTAKLYKKTRNGRREGLATLELIKTKNLSAKTKNEIDILRSELLIDDKRYDDAEKILSRVKASRQFRIQAQYLLGVVFSHKNACDQFVKEVTPAILSQTEIDPVFSTGHMYAFADCAAEMSQTSDAIAYLEYAKIQKGVESDEKSRINYLMSKYDGRNFDLPPLEKDSEEPLWNTLLREKKKSDDFTEKYEKWKSESK